MQAEDFYFLGGLDAGRGLPHIVELAALRRAAKIERVGARIEMRLAEKARHEGHQQQQDEPRRVKHQPRREAGDRHDVLRLRKKLSQQCHPAAGLPPRPFELVLELGVLEIFQV